MSPRRWKYFVPSLSTVATRNDTPISAFATSLAYTSAPELVPDTYAPTTARPPGNTALARRKSARTSSSS